MRTWPLLPKSSPSPLTENSRHVKALMMTDSQTQNLRKSPKSAAEGGPTSFKSDYFPSISRGDLMLKQNLSCCLLHLMAKSHQPCRAGWAARAKRV